MNHLKKMLWVAVLTLRITPVFAQSADTAWVRIYNGPGNSDDEVRGIVLDCDGNIYVTGYSTGSGTNYDYCTIKYYPNGDTAWVRRYNGPPGTGVDKASGIAIDDSNNIYVTGASKDNDINIDIVTIKYYPNGDTGWVRRCKIPGSNWSSGIGIAIDGSGAIYVIGGSAGNPIWDYVTIKYYPDGDTAWVRRYDGMENDNNEAYGLTIDDSGNVYVTGSSLGGESDFDYATIRYYPNGDTAWVRRYNGSGNSMDAVNGITKDNFGNVYVTGKSIGIGTYYDYATVKYYPNGDTAWVRRYSSSGGYYDGPFGIVTDNCGNIYITGESSGATDFDYLTVKYYPNGDTAWTQRYNDEAKSIDEARSIALDSSGCVYVTGYSRGDFATIKYNPNGDTSWIRRLSVSEHYWDEPLAVVVDRYENVYVTGSTVNAQADYGDLHDYVIIKYIQNPNVVRDKDENSEEPSALVLSQNSPNPFNPSTRIQYIIPGSKHSVLHSLHTTLKIYNILGEKVRTLVDNIQPPGNYSIQWDGKDDDGNQVANGIYLYELRLNNYTLTKKMILLR